jgi:hypothetical protein
VQLVKSLDTPPDEANKATGGWSRWELRERSLQYIDDHLGDQELSPVGIAAAHSVSVRTLYAAVDGLGVTLATYYQEPPPRPLLRRLGPPQQPSRHHRTAMGVLRPCSLQPGVSGNVTA